MHIPSNVAWGHAVCNTHLGQRPCLSLAQIKQMGRKVGIINPDGSIETFGWISDDDRMIRSPLGAVWIQLNGDMAGDEDTPPEPDVETLPLEEAIVELEDEEHSLE